MTARALNRFIEIVRYLWTGRLHSSHYRGLPGDPGFRVVIGTDRQFARVVTSRATDLRVRRIMPRDLGQGHVTL